MYKTIIPIYIVCFALYVFFSRRPDYQDGEITTGTIHYIKDNSQKFVAAAIFSIDTVTDTINATYPLRNLQEGQFVKIIYETNDPSKAAVYKWWGYWLQWDELLASVLIPFIFFYAAKAITANPTAEAVVEQLEMRDSHKREKNN